MSHLGEDFPPLAQDLGNGTVHLLHTKESLPVVDPAPTSFVGERFHLACVPYQPMVGNELPDTIVGLSCCVTERLWIAVGRPTMNIPGG